MYRLILIIIIILYNVVLNAQFIPVNQTHESTYFFLDELANEKLISIKSLIKPYSKQEILSKLEVANQNRESLNERQRAELDYYLRIYKLQQGKKNPYSSSSKLNIFKKSSTLSTGINPVGLFYKDSVTTISIKPIWGIHYYLVNNKNIHHTWGGAEAYITYSNHWGFYANLRENNMSEPLSLPSYLVKSEGGNYKIDAEGINASTYSEMRGGITYSWKWGVLGIVKDQLVWGENYNGANIISGRAPSFPMLTFKMTPVRWLSFDYFHGWLVSQVIDSTRSYITSNGDQRFIYRNKYMAANMYTIIPSKSINFSFGNSIIYSDININPAFFIPFLFYKSVDHTISYGVTNHNSQMFGSLSIRLIKHMHFFGTIFIDDFSILRVFDKERQNFISYKSGVLLTNWPISNTNFIFEYVKTNPIVYKHRIPSITFASNNFNLGHYLGDNSEEYHFEFGIKPFRGFITNFSYNYAQHGNEYEYIDGNSAENLPFLKDITWKNISYAFEISYEVVSESYFYISLIKSNIKGFEVDDNSAQYYLDLYTPKMFQGNNLMLNLGFNIGF